MERYKRIAINSLIFALCLVVFAPFQLRAELTEAPIKYSSSITEDEEGRRLLFPSSVFVDPVKYDIYVISESRVIVYNKDMFPLYTLGKGDGIETPQGLTFDVEGNLYVAQGATKDNPKHRITVFNSCLKWERDIYLEGFEGAESFIPNHLAVDKRGNLYVVANYFPGVVILDKQGKLLDVLSIKDGEKKVKLTNLTLDETGKIYAVSEEEGRVYVYDENKKFLFKFGEKGGSTGKLSRPMGVAVDTKHAKMYVVDYMRHTITVYDKDGKYLSEIGGLGWGEGWFQYPRDIVANPGTKILVADTFNNRIEVFEINE